MVQRAGSAQRARPPISQSGRIEYAWSEWSVMYPLICSPDLMQPSRTPPKSPVVEHSAAPFATPGGAVANRTARRRAATKIGRIIGRSAPSEPPARYLHSASGLAGVSPGLQRDV